MPTAVPPAGGRGPGGKFLPGNRCAAGNPFFRKLAANRRAFAEAAGPADVAAVAGKLKELALAGDVQAAQVFLAYAIGKPRPAPNPDYDDLDELQVVAANPTKAQLLVGLMDLVDAGTAARLVRENLPAGAAATLDEVRSALKRPGTTDAAAAERAARVGR